MPRASSLLIGLGLLGVPLATASSARQAPAAADFRAVFQRLDANGDTVLERDEIPESGRDAFDRLLKRGDANKDGKLQADEMRALGQKLRAAGNGNAAGNGAGMAPAARFQAMDKDGDGKVSRAEFPGPAPLFDRMDADGDGVLTRPEALRFAAAQAPAARPAAEPDAKGPAARFRMLDRDGDGKVSKAEFPRAKAFDRLDADGDGTLSPEELGKGPRPGAPKAP